MEFIPPHQLPGRPIDLVPILTSSTYSSYQLRTNKRHDFISKGSLHITVRQQPPSIRDVSFFSTVQNISCSTLSVSSHHADGVRSEWSVLTNTGPELVQQSLLGPKLVLLETEQGLTHGRQVLRYRALTAAQYLALRGHLLPVG